MPTDAPPLPPPNALVVNDDPDILIEIAERLEAVGHRSTGVSSVEGARAALAQGGWDYLVLDLEIPIKFGRPNRVENGLALLGEVNQQDGHLPVVVITAHGHESSEPGHRVDRSGRCARSSAQGSADAVHESAASRRHRASAGQLPLVEEVGRPRRRWDDVDGIATIKLRRGRSRK